MCLKRTSSNGVLSSAVLKYTIGRPSMSLASVTMNLPDSASRSTSSIVIDKGLNCRSSAV